MSKGLLGQSFRATTAQISLKGRHTDVRPNIQITWEEHAQSVFIIAPSSPMPSWLPLSFSGYVGRHHSVQRSHSAHSSSTDLRMLCMSALGNAATNLLLLCVRKGQDAAWTVGLNDPWMCVHYSCLCVLYIFLQAEDEIEINTSMLKFNIKHGVIVWWTDFPMGWETISDFYFNSLYWFNWGNFWTRWVSDHHIGMTICHCFYLNSQDVALQFLKWWMHMLLNMEMKVCSTSRDGFVLIYMIVWQL